MKAAGSAEPAFTMGMSDDMADKIEGPLEGMCPRMCPAINYEHN